MRLGSFSTALTCRGVVVVDMRTSIEMEVDAGRHHADRSAPSQLTVEIGRKMVANVSIGRYWPIATLRSCSAAWMLSHRT